MLPEPRPAPTIISPGSAVRSLPSPPATAPSELSNIPSPGPSLLQLPSQNHRRKSQQLSISSMDGLESSSPATFGRLSPLPEAVDVDIHPMDEVGEAPARSQSRSASAVISSFHPPPPPDIQPLQTAKPSSSLLAVPSFHTRRSEGRSQPTTQGLQSPQPVLSSLHPGPPHGETPANQSVPDSDVMQVEQPYPTTFPVRNPVQPPAQQTWNYAATSDFQSQGSATTLGDHLAYHNQSFNPTSVNDNAISRQQHSQQSSRRVENVAAPTVQPVTQSQFTHHARSWSTFDGFAPSSSREAVNNWSAGQQPEASTSSLPSLPPLPASPSEPEPEISGLDRRPRRRKAPSVIEAAGIDKGKHRASPGTLSGLRSTSKKRPTPDEEPDAESDGDGGDSEYYNESHPRASSSKSGVSKSVSPPSVTPKPIKGKHKFLCPQPGCGKMFTRKNDVRRHLQTAAAHRDFAQEDEASDARCKKCGRILSRGDSARRHYEGGACGKRTLPSEQVQQRANGVKTSSRRRKEN